MDRTLSAATDMTAEAIATQSLSTFTGQGWLKVIAPAKVNLHLAIGAKREDGYHEVATVLHALNLHDVVYMRRSMNASPDAQTQTAMLARNGIVLPEVPAEDNLASRAVRTLAQLTGRERADAPALEIRIEKSIPAQAGLGGGSADAAAALIGAAALWGIPADDPALHEAACLLGSDIAFFLDGGCAYFTGKGDLFHHALAPSRKAIVLAKPAKGVSTGEAYRTFDADPCPVPAELAEAVQSATAAEQVRLFNNMESAAQNLLPALYDIKRQLMQLPGVEDALLCGSGSATFAVCADFDSATRAVFELRKQGFWARATSLGALRCAVVNG